MVTVARMAMRTGNTTMHIDAQLLTLVQWLSPAFPVSGFAYSHGLEMAVAARRVSSGETLERWLCDILTEGSGRTDAIWIRLAYEEEDRGALTELNHEARAFIPARLRLLESERQGHAFVRTVNAVWELDLPPLLLPLAVGAAARQKNLDIDLVVPTFLQGFVSNLLSAAQRLMGLGQTEAQAILARLQPVCLRVADGSRGKSIDDVHSTAFLSEIMAMRHETLEPRLFQS